MKVLGIGNALVDVLIAIEDDTTLANMQLPKGSMQLIDEDRLNIINNYIQNFDKTIASGGSASNTTISISKLGIETGFIGKVGNDFYGNYFKNDLEKYGVKSHLIEVDKVSGVANAFISQNGERTFATFLGAAATLTPEDLTEKDYTGYDYFYIEGYLVQNLDLIRKSLILAKKAGLKVALDLASYNIVEESRDFLLEIIPQYVDILFANEEEIKALINVSPTDAMEILAPQVEIVVVKIGEKGSLIQQGEEKIAIPVEKIEPADTTGAGDLYAAGFLYGLIKNYSLKTCGDIGSLLAKHIIQVIGAKMSDDMWDLIKKELNKL